MHAPPLRDFFHNLPQHFFNPAPNQILSSSLPRRTAPRRTGRFSDQFFQTLTHAPSNPHPCPPHSHAPLSPLPNRAPLPALGPTSRPVPRHAGFARRFHLTDHCNELLEESLDWFNLNLPVPRLGSQDARPIFWFRTEAEECLAKIWNLVAIFNEEGLYVERRTTRRPGHIIYRDNHQIAAIPNKR